jgi:tripartite-type tricarboxylate transporter receptor subunit TctC
MVVPTLAQVAAIAALASALYGTDAAAAQPYPSRPITIIVPTTAGGPPDTIARLLGEPMRRSLGQPIIAENVTGAGGTLAIGRVVRAEPDGYMVRAVPEGSNLLPHLRSGKIKTYAVLTQTRWAAAPDIPTIDEAGGPPFYLPFWHGLWVPKGTPEDVIAKLNRAVVEALADPTVRTRLAGLGQGLFPREQQTPHALAAFYKAEIEKWWPIIKAAGIKAE